MRLREYSPRRDGSSNVWHKLIVSWFLLVYATVQRYYAPSCDPFISPIHLQRAQRPSFPESTIVTFPPATSCDPDASPRPSDHLRSASLYARPHTRARARHRADLIHPTSHSGPSLERYEYVYRSDTCRTD